MKIEASGGPPQQIAPATGFMGGTWNADGTIIFGGPQGLMRVAAEGGTPEALTKLDKDEGGHFWPHFLPDGRRFLYTAWRAQTQERGVYVGSLDSGEKVKVLAADSNAAYVEPGYLVFRRGSAIYAQPFDASDLQLSGEPVRLADAVTFDPGNGQGHFSVSRTGALAYFFNDGSNDATGVQSDVSEWQLAWTNRQGQVLQAIGPPAAYRGFELSPDGTRVAVHRHDATGGDVWVIEPRGSDTRLTFDASRHNSAPVWSPDGSRIAFSSQRGGKWGLYATLSSGSGTEELLRESEQPTAPMSWAPDGKRLVFWVRDAKAGGDLWVLTLDDKKAEPFAATPFNETHAQISPDGRWIAFASDSKDNRDEIYVRPFPAGPGQYQISNNGGDWPRWRRDGKELYFKSVGNVATPGLPAGGFAFVGTLFAVTIESRGLQLEPGSPLDVINFPTLNHPHSGGDFHTYAVSADGSRFLYPQYAPSAAAVDTGIGPDLPSGLTVAIGWTHSLAKRHER
jgi:Tol biopolymer transport system component